MADWVPNELVINGPAREVEALLEASVRGDTLDFGGLVPVPADIPDQNPDVLSGAEYHWRDLHWGCKWVGDAVSVSRPLKSVAVLSFGTPYTPPLPWLRNVAGQLPRLLLSLSYEAAAADERFWQTLTIRSGKEYGGLLLYTPGADSRVTARDWQVCERRIDKLSAHALAFDDLNWLLEIGFVSVDAELLERMADYQAGRTRSSGPGPLGQRVLELVRQQPGVSGSEIAKQLQIKPNYFYRLMAGLERTGRVTKKERRFFPGSDSGDAPIVPGELSATGFAEAMEQVREQLRADLMRVRKASERAVSFPIRRRRQREAAHIFGQFGRVVIKRERDKIAEYLQAIEVLVDQRGQDNALMYMPIPRLRFVRPEVGGAYARLVATDVLPTRRLRTPR